MRAAALVIMSAIMYGTTAADGGTISIAVSGATTISAATNQTAGIILQMTLQNSSGGQTPGMWAGLVTGLTAGVNVFKMQYEAAGGGTAGFYNRNLTVIGIP